MFKSLLLLLKVVIFDPLCGSILLFSFRNLPKISANSMQIVIFCQFYIFCVMFLSSVSANIVILKKWRFNIVINIIKLIFYNDIREKIEVHIVIFLPKMEVQSVIFDP